jgi:hypothetical protein
MESKMKEFEFQAETKQLLNLMIHSLYTNTAIPWASLGVWLKTPRTWRL